MTTADERAPFLQTLESRVQQKMAQHKVSLPEELLKLRAKKDDQVDEEGEEKEDPTIHYDKEDLISFH